MTKKTPKKVKVEKIRVWIPKLARQYGDRTGYLEAVLLHEPHIYPMLYEEATLVIKPDSPTKE